MHAIILLLALAISPDYDVVGGDDTETALMPAQSAPVAVQPFSVADAIRQSTSLKAKQQPAATNVQSRTVTRTRRIRRG